MIILLILTTSLIHFPLKGWENVTFWPWELKAELSVWNLGKDPIHTEVLDIASTKVVYEE